MYVISQYWTQTHGTLYLSQYWKSGWQTQTHMLYLSIEKLDRTHNTHMLYLTCLSHTQLTCQAVLPGLSRLHTHWDGRARIFAPFRLTFFTSSGTSIFLASVVRGHLSKTEPDFGHQGPVGLLGNPPSVTNGHFVKAQLGFCQNRWYN